MRARRVLGNRECCVYHCISRTVNGEMLLRDKEKAVLRKMLLQVVEFSGVELITYAIMTNHIHVFVRVRADARNINDAELLRRFRVLYPKPTDFQTMSNVDFEQALKTGEADGLRTQLLARMGDVSEFMRTLKQRFSIWYNKSHNRFGPFWNDRFKSVILENSPAVLQTVAAYIDLNPVRAGIVEDPKDYPYCGYFEALKGKTWAQAGVALTTGAGNITDALNDYRILMMGKLFQSNPRKVSSTGIGMQAPSDYMNLGNQLHQTYLRQRLPFISEGIALGSSLFVEALVDHWSPQIGDRRKRVPKEAPGRSEWVTFRRVRSS